MARWSFWIDVGGTFTDCVARAPDGRIHCHKTLSSAIVKGQTGKTQRGHLADPARAADPDGIWQGYDIRFAGQAATSTIEAFEAGVLHVRDRRVPVDTSYELISPEPAPLVAIRYLLGIPLHASLPPLDLRLGTTRGTNALITRNGSRTALVTTQGFRDVLRIGYQTRPHLFAVDIQKPDELYEQVVEVNERMSATGEVLVELSLDEARNAFAALRREGIESLAIVLLHACANGDHERQLLRVANEFDFRNVSLSHTTTSLRKIVPRGDTTVMDAYLTPILNDYLTSIRRVLHPDSQLHMMTSSGGLAAVESFRGKDSVLSGPAGGVVGVAHVAGQLGRRAAIGFDMGGTSTDVSRWADERSAGEAPTTTEFALDYETEKAGQRIATPMMAVETVAAGGGSICGFDGVKFTVGPQSAGADPGPACYGRSGPLSITDINVYLGRIAPAAFPFPLDIEAIHRRLEEQQQEVHNALGQTLTLEAIAAGYLRIANANMAEAIRCVSVERGMDPRNHLLVAFGGAAAQHACAVADELHMQEVAIHPHAGILSAHGIGLAEVTVHKERGVYRQLATVTAAERDDWFQQLEQSALAQLAPGDQPTEFHRYLDLRFVGLDTSICVREDPQVDFGNSYRRAFQTRSGYLPAEQSIEVVTARVTATIVRPTASTRSRLLETRTHPTASAHQTAQIQGRSQSIPVFSRAALTAGNTIPGPAIITEAISSIVVDDGWQASVATGGEILLRRVEQPAALPETVDTSLADPILLEVFNKRFAAIATQMGATLRKTSRSVNVKERLDFSCAIFTAQGELVVNAPHIPVHLGAMGATVRHVLDTMPLQANDVVVTNDPFHGGSHLPDVTVITPVHSQQGELLFLTASRAHHAEIGGTTPGSMPAFSTTLAEEGKLIRAMKVISGGVSQMAQLESLLASPPYPSRDPGMNLADIAAQIAANRLGYEGLLRFVAEYSWPVVAAYMQFIQDAAEQKTRTALGSLPAGTRTFEDHLDDGTPIAVELSIQHGQARLDFQGSGPVLAGNLNANPAIVAAATLYCLRLLINDDISLNAGVLRPVELVLPTGLLNPPSHADPQKCPAVVGGNVETSQRVVDVILGAFGIAAASQGTMNNFLFGDDTFGYYETICGGAGATAQADGADAVHTHMTNTRLTDPETLEQRFPVRLRRFAIRADSGGEGQFRGGHGVIREIEFLRPLQVSLLTQRRGPYAPYGVSGGQSGKLGRNILVRKHQAEEQLAGLAQIDVQPGDVIRIETPGGGGWGNGPMGLGLVVTSTNRAGTYRCSTAHRTTQPLRTPAPRRESLARL